MNEGIRKITLFASVYYLLKVLLKGVMLCALLFINLAVTCDVYIRRKGWAGKISDQCRKILQSKYLN